MNQSVKVGVVGTGFIAPIHIEAARRTCLAEVVALVGRNPETAEKKARQFAVPKWYGDYRALLEDPEVEAVHITTPNNLHFPMAKEALLAGKHVICEKPLTMTQEESAELLALAEKTGLIHAVHFNVRYYPLARESRELISRGEVGDLYAVRGAYLQDWLYYDTDYSWRLEPEMSGESRAIADIGSHWLDLIEYVTQKRVAEVLADFATFHPTRKKPRMAVETWSSKLLKSEDYEEVPIHTEDFANVLLRFEDGSRGSLTVNQMAAGHKNQILFEINGSKSSLSWDSERPNELAIGRREKANEVLLRDPALVSEETRRIVAYPGGHIEGFADTSKQLFTEVYQHILNRKNGIEWKATYPTFHDGYRQDVLCDSILESVKTRGWVTVAPK